MLRKTNEHCRPPSHISQHLHALTVERHKEPDLSILHPLPNAIARGLLHARDERSIIYDAVEDLAHRPLLLRRLGGGLRRAILRSRPWSSGSLHTYSVRLGILSVLRLLQLPGNTQNFRVRGVGSRNATGGGAASCLCVRSSAGERVQEPVKRL